MNWESNKINNVSVIRITSELINQMDSDDFNNFLIECIDQDQLNIVIDVSGINYFNSSHIGIIVRGFKTLNNAGGNMKIGGAGEKVNTIFKVGKLDTVFELFPTVEKAVESFN